MLPPPQPISASIKGTTLACAIIRRRGSMKYFPLCGIQYGGASFTRRVGLGSWRVCHCSWRTYSFTLTAALAPTGLPRHRLGDALVEQMHVPGPVAPASRATGAG